MPTIILDSSSDDEDGESAESERQRAPSPTQLETAMAEMNLEDADDVSRAPKMKNMRECLRRKGIPCTGLRKEELFQKYRDARRLPNLTPRELALRQQNISQLRTLVKRMNDARPAGVPKIGYYIKKAIL